MDRLVPEVMEGAGQAALHLGFGRNNQHRSAFHVLAPWAYRLSFRVHCEGRVIPATFVPADQGPEIPGEDINAGTLHCVGKGSVPGSRGKKV